MPAEDPTPALSAELEAALVARFGPRLRAHVERRMGARVRRWVEPEDIVQRVLAEVLPGLPRPLDQVEDDEVLRRLQRVANHRITDAARKHAPEAGESAQPTPVDALGQPTPSVGPVTRADQDRWLQELVARLPDGYREVVQRCALEGQTFVEAAADLGLEPDAVRKRYHRARELLAAKIATRRHGPSA